MLLFIGFIKLLYVSKKNFGDAIIPFLITSLYFEEINFQADSLAKETAENLEKLCTLEKNIELAPVLETAPKIEKIHIGGVDEENSEDALLPR